MKSKTEKAMKSKTEKVVDIIYYAAMIFFCGMVAGYTCCYMALD